MIRLGGRTGPADNWALGSAALPKDLFRVTVSISGMTESSCAVGRPGRVVFEPKVASAANASAAGRVLSVLGLR